MGDISELQQPGEDIRPPALSIENVASLSKKLYGLNVTKIKSLDGYDDKNFHLVDSTLLSDNKYITSVWPHGYVLKVVNALDSQNTQFIEAQTHLLIHIENRGICVPTPIKTLSGEYFCREKLAKDDGGVAYYVIRLFKYQPGIMLKEALAQTLSPTSLSCLFHELGEKAASLDMIMKEFQNSALCEKKSLWNLPNASEVRKYLFSVKEEEKVSIVLKVLDEFDQSVVKKIKHLKTGLIHGDLNESNILVTRINSTDEELKYSISVILDFNDMHVSPYVLELAILMCYIMVVTRSIEIGTFVLEGYHKIHPLSIEEYKLLPVSVCARLCQSLVMGIYTYSLDQSNTYVMQTQLAGWELLRKLVSVDKDTISKLWMKNIL